MKVYKLNANPLAYFHIQLPESWKQGISRLEIGKIPLWENGRPNRNEVKNSDVEYSPQNDPIRSPYIKATVTNSAIKRKPGCLDICIKPPT